MAHLRGVRLFVSVAIASALASGCKDDDEGLSADEAPQTLAQRVCSAYYECGCEARNPDRFTSQEDCELEVASEIQSDIDEGEEADLTYQPECADDIADVFAVIECNSLTEIFVDTALLAEVDRLETCKLFHGTRTAGQPCEPLESGNGDNCEADLLCEAPNNGGEPVCRVARRTKVEGEECVEGNDCVVGLVCVDVDGGTDAVCRDLPVAGETCLGTLDLCDLDHACDQTSKTCDPLPTAGEPCAASGDVFGRTCATDSTCDNDTCVANPGGGESCNASCMVGFVCDGGVCAEEAPAVCVFN